MHRFKWWSTIAPLRSRDGESNWVLTTKSVASGNNKRRKLCTTAPSSRSSENSDGDFWESRDVIGRNKVGAGYYDCVKHVLAERMQFRQPGNHQQLHPYAPEQDWCTPRFDNYPHPHPTSDDSGNLLLGTVRKGSPHCSKRYRGQ